MFFLRVLIPILLSLGIIFADPIHAATQAEDEDGHVTFVRSRFEKLSSSDAGEAELAAYQLLGYGERGPIYADRVVAGAEEKKRAAYSIYREVLRSTLNLGSELPNQRRAARLSLRRNATLAIPFVNAVIKRSADRGWAAEAEMLRPTLGPASPSIRIKKHMAASVHRASLATTLVTWVQAIRSALSGEERAEIRRINTNDRDLKNLRWGVVRVGGEARRQEQHRLDVKHRENLYREAIDRAGFTIVETWTHTFFDRSPDRPVGARADEHFVARVRSKTDEGIHLWIGASPAGFLGFRIADSADGDLFEAMPIAFESIVLPVKLVEAEIGRLQDRSPYLIGISVEAGWDQSLRVTASARTSLYDSLTAYLKEAFPESAKNFPDWLDPKSTSEEEKQSLGYVR